MSLSTAVTVITASIYEVVSTCQTELHVTSPAPQDNPWTQDPLLHCIDGQRVARRSWVTNSPRMAGLTSKEARPPVWDSVTPTAQFRPTPHKAQKAPRTCLAQRHCVSMRLPRAQSTLWPPETLLETLLRSLSARTPPPEIPIRA